MEFERNHATKNVMDCAKIWSEQLSTIDEVFEERTCAMRLEYHQYLCDVVQRSLDPKIRERYKPNYTDLSRAYTDTFLAIHALVGLLKVQSKEVKRGAWEVIQGIIPFEIRQTYETARELNILSRSFHDEIFRRFSWHTPPFAYKDLLADFMRGPPEEYDDTNPYADVDFE